MRLTTAPVLVFPEVVANRSVPFDDFGRWPGVRLPFWRRVAARCGGRRGANRARALAQLTAGKTAPVRVEHAEEEAQVRRNAAAERQVAVAGLGACQVPETLRA